MSTEHVARPDSRGQPVGGVIRDSDGVCFIFEFDDRQDWAEDFFSSNCHVVSYPSDDRRFKETSLGQAGIGHRRFTPRDHDAALFLSHRHEVTDLLQLRGKAYGTHLRERVRWISEPDACGSSSQARDDIIGYRLLNEQT